MRNLPQRKPNRLKGYDYSQNGAYFITICAKDRAELFGRIICEPTPVRAATCRPPTTESATANEWQIATPTRPFVELSEHGKMVETAIVNIAAIYQDVDVRAYTIMPNHIHLIIVINEGGRQVAAPTKSTAPTISTIVGNMKRYVSINIGFSPWQKSFHDHIIRSEEDCARIAEYIENNPANWKSDCFYAKKDTE
jgi:REP element-mobilizing transposase RayT